jgi:hypothetical protein
MKPPSLTNFNEFTTRDIVLLASEATADGVGGKCNEPPHWSFIVDVTVENSKTCPPGTRPFPMYRERIVQCRPRRNQSMARTMVLSTMSVDERAGAKFKRGNYCGRGARFRRSFE